MSSLETLLARVFAVAFTFVACLFGTREIWVILGTLGYNTIDRAVVALFVPCFAWVTFGAAMALVGLYGLVLRRHMSAGPPLAGAAPKTALCVPICHESPASVFAHIETMAEALVARGVAGRFDFFVLSDSKNPAAWLCEERAWAELSQRLAGKMRIYYRKRMDNVGRKAGNLREFCMRFGADYRYMIVLDADSVMGAETLCELVRRMEVRPRAGIIQVPPLPVRRQTPFARLQQFAAAVYGPLWSRGASILWGGDGNYFGHNAIIRIEPFQRHCGLAPLSGRGSLSGTIMSHDFVEAALIRRAGYEVWLADDLAQSYEHCPTTLIDYAIRDRRWCQGNLQHVRIALGPGFHWSSRFHLLYGAMSYLAAPLWLAFVLSSVLAAARDLAIAPVYFPPQRTLFPDWPIFDYGAAYSLLWLSLAILFGPRILAVIAFLARNRVDVRAASATLFSVMLEILLSTLIAPALMMFQTSFVATTLFGERVGWASQARADRRVSLREALLRHRVHMIVGVLLALVAYLVSERTLLWQAPLVLGLLLSPVLTILTSSALLGRVLQGLGLLLAPEDRAQPALLSALDRNEASRSDDMIDPMRALEDQALMRVHSRIVVQSGMLERLADRERARLLARRARHERLSDAETIALLRDPVVLSSLVTQCAGQKRG